MVDREKLIQQDLIDTHWGPWKVLVACQMLNRTTYKQVEKVLFDGKFFAKWPDPFTTELYFHEFYTDMIERLKPLGMSEKRARNIASMSSAFRKTFIVFGSLWHNYCVRDYDGCGVYAEDAWYLFVLKRPRRPSDKRLLWYAKEHGLYE